MAQNLKPNRSDNRGGSRIGSGAKEKGNVQYKRNIHPSLVDLMDAYLATLKATLLILLFVSCGKRVTSIERVEIKKDSIRIENKVELTQNITMADIGTLRPLDNYKPMLLNGKWYYNTIIEFDKSIKKELEIKAGENLSYTGSESEIKNKQAEKTDYSNSIIGVIFVLALFLFLYIYLKNWKP